jgi:2-methylcitrate dehydratase PrpD
MTTKATHGFENLLGALVSELIEMPDEQALEGVAPAIAQAEGLRLLQAAKVQAGKARLAAAKAGRAAVQAPPVTVAQSANVTPDEARRFIGQTANDGRYALAARSLRDMPDDEVLRLYVKLRSLQSDPHGADR